jgi:hypothetical protein
MRRHGGRITNLYFFFEMKVRDDEHAIYRRTDNKEIKLLILIT